MHYNGLYESIMLVNDCDIQVPFAECINGHCDDCSHEKPVWLLLACLTYLAIRREGVKLARLHLEYMYICHHMIFHKY